MAITTYSELKTAVTNWFMDRGDLAAYADEFIDLSEAYFNLELRCREMETSTDLTPSSNVCTLPTDYLEYKRVVEKVSPRRPLEYITEDGADQIYPDRESGLSCHFMIIGDNLTALPLSSNDIELTYYQKIPALSDSNTTNWLLTRSPGLYLHTCLFHAAVLTKNENQQALEAALSQSYMRALESLDERSKFGNAGVTLSGNIF